MYKKGLTDDQEKKAWDLFLTTHDNRDKIIAEKINASRMAVSRFIAYKLDIHIAKINNK